MTSAIERPGDFFVPPICAYTAQVPRLFSDSLRDNILMGLDRTDGRYLPGGAIGGDGPGLGRV